MWVLQRLSGSGPPRGLLCRGCMSWRNIPALWDTLPNREGSEKKYPDFFLFCLQFPASWDLPNPGIKPRSPTLQADSLPAEPPRKSKNTGVGSLSLLQRILLTQELNWGLLHCRRFFTSWATREGFLPVQFRVWTQMEISLLGAQPIEPTVITSWTTKKSRNREGLSAETENNPHSHRDSIPKIIPGWTLLRLIYSAVFEEVVIS